MTLTLTYLSKVILVKAMRNRIAGEIVRAYTTIMDRLSKGDVEPTVHLLDNECLEECREAFTENNSKFQLVLPNNHCRNTAEKSSKLSRIILWLCCVGRMTPPPYRCGASCFPTRRCN